VTGSDESTLAFAELQPDDILTTMEELGFRCDGRFLALNSYENRVYQIGITGGHEVLSARTLER
jgi:Ser/Thr protein kinase RdoA (MazF antagonist)